MVLKTRAHNKGTPTGPRRQVAVVDGNAAGRLGLGALLASLPAFCLSASVATPTAFWQLPGALLWQLDELLVNPASLSDNPQAGRLFLRQVRMLLPGLRVRVLISGLTSCDLDDNLLDYQAGLAVLRRALCREYAEAARPPPPLTAGEWRVLTGGLCGLSAAALSALTGRSVKTLYAQRYTGMRKLGISKLPELLTEGPRGWTDQAHG